MVPGSARRKLRNEFHDAIQQSVRDAVDQGVSDVTLFLLDLRDERAQKMSASVADLETVHKVVAAAETSQRAPVLVAYTTSTEAAKLMSGHSRKVANKFAAKVPLGRFRMIVVGSGGITWATSAVETDGPTGRVVG